MHFYTNKALFTRMGLTALTKGLNESHNVFNAIIVQSYHFADKMKTLRRKAAAKYEKKAMDEKNIRRR